MKRTVWSSICSGSRPRVAEIEMILDSAESFLEVARR
jgi:hypothetical protein